MFGVYGGVGTVLHFAQFGFDFHEINLKGMREVSSVFRGAAVLNKLSRRIATILCFRTE